MKNIRELALLALLTIAGLSCGGDGTGSQPGTLNVRLTTPNSGLDSAIVVTINGPVALTGARAGTGLRMFSQPLGGTLTRFALTGQLNANAVILQIDVKDVSAVSQYSGTVDQVAMPTFQLRSTAGYALAITR
jgi:hypothetical protein